MDKEQLEDYDAREVEKYELLKKKIKEGKFDITKDRFPPNERFRNLQEPVAYASTIETTREANIWAQVPFCGSLLIDIPPVSKREFEETYFEVSKIPKIIDFVKETGKLQFVLSAYPNAYQGLEYLDPILEELHPPYFGGIPNMAFGNEIEIRNARETFLTLAKINYIGFLKALTLELGTQIFDALFIKSINQYIRLKLSDYAIVEEIEDQMVDDPVKAFMTLNIFRILITGPLDDLRSNICNLTLTDFKTIQGLPLTPHAKKMKFPCEIGKFLLSKLTYAPQGIRACSQLIDHYDSYDLRRVQESLNEAIIMNRVDIINSSVKDLNEILDNVWNTPTIPRRIKGLKVGIPIAMAAIGSVAAGPIGTAGGFLAGLGFDLVSEFVNIGTEGLAERAAKLATKNYQANIYDFQKKYKHIMPMKQKKKKLNEENR